MKDLEILQACLNGNHLSNAEIQRAEGLIYLMQQDIKARVRE